MIKKLLRGYQEDAINEALVGFTQEVDGEGPYDKQLLVEPTGSGKTVIFATMADYCVTQWKKPVLVLVDQKDLADQARDEIMDWTHLEPQVEQGERQASAAASVTIATVQSIANRLDRFPSDRFGLVIADEADRSVADQWQKVLGHFDKSAKVLGVTATPDRNDQRSVLDYYERIAHEMTIFDLIKLGYLSKIMVQTVPLQIDISKVKQTAGDYDAAQLDAALTPYFNEICEGIKQYAPDRKTLVFLPLIDTSKRFVDIAQTHGIKAAHIDGTASTDDRLWIKDRFARREINLLSNAMLLGRGYNDRAIDCIINLRPTRSGAMYRQFVGRGTRTFCPHGCPERCGHADAKKDLLLLDFLWTFHKLGLQRPANLIAISDDQAKRLTDYSSRSKEALDLEGIDSKVALEAEQTLLKQLMKGRQRKPGFVDAMEFAVKLHERDLLEYKARAKWERKPMSPKQRDAIIAIGFDPDSVEDFGHAHKLLDYVAARRKKGLATLKQLKHLRRFNVENAERVTFDGATALLDHYFNDEPLKQDVKIWLTEEEMCASDVADHGAKLEDASADGGAADGVGREPVEIASTPAGLDTRPDVAPPPATPEPLARKIRVEGTGGADQPNEDKDEVTVEIPLEEPAPPAASTLQYRGDPEQQRQMALGFAELKAKIAAIPDSIKK